MKTKIIGIFAIALAISLSAFTNPKKTARPTGPYWFAIDDGIAKGLNAVPADDAMFLQQSPTAPSATGCNTTKPNQCISGFDAGQVNTTTDRLKDDVEVSAHQSTFQN